MTVKLFTDYFSSKEFQNLDAYAMAIQPFDVFCSRAASRPKVDGSQTSRVSRF